MATNSIKTRIINKHDIEANWNLATNFIPNKGELIIYDKDTNYDYPRLKIGDGSTKVGVLPFIDKNLTANIENIYALINNYTTLSTTQTISGAKTFTGGIVANSIISGSGIINNTTVGGLGWNSADLRLINANTLAYWNGSYNGTTSNLSILGTIKTGTWNGTKIAIGYGGTGTSTAPTQGGIIYGASTSAYGCTAAGTSGYVLKSNGTSAPSWIAQSELNVNRAKFLETFKEGNTTETYGTQYPLWAQWENGTILKLLCTGYSTKVDIATKDADGNTITSKYVTVDTAQTISGNKTFTGKNIFTASNSYNTTDTQKFIVGNSSSAFVFGGDGLQCFTGTNSTTAKAMYVQYYGGDLIIGSGGKVTIASGGAISTPSTITATGNITSSADVIGNYLCTKTAAEESSASTSIAVVASNGYIRKLSMPSGANYDSGSDIWSKLVGVGLQYLSTGSSQPQGGDYFISQYAGGGTTHPEFYRRPISALWGYMNTQAATVYAKLKSPNDMIHNNNEVCWVPDSYDNYIWINYRSVGGTGKSTVTGYKFGNANGKTEGVFVEANTFSLLQNANMTYNSTDKCIEFTFA